MTDATPEFPGFLDWINSDAGKAAFNPDAIAEFVASEHGKELLQAFSMFMPSSPEKHSEASDKPVADLGDQDLMAIIFQHARAILEETAQQRVQASYGDGAFGDEGFRHPVPTRVPHQLLQLLTPAVEAAGAVIAILGMWASASVFSQIRFIHETHALMAWLVTGPEEELEARAHGLVLDAMDILNKGKDHCYKTAKCLSDPQLKKIAQRYEKAQKIWKKDLADLAAKSRIAPIAKPIKREELYASHNETLGGYLEFALLSNSGAHPGLTQTWLMYTDPAQNYFQVFDFAGKYIQRAFWMSKTIESLLGLMDLAAPHLGWDDWKEESEALRAAFEPFRAESARRYETSWLPPKSAA